MFCADDYGILLVTGRVLEAFGRSDDDGQSADRLGGEDAVAADRAQRLAAQVQAGRIDRSRQFLFAATRLWRAHENGPSSVASRLCRSVRPRFLDENASTSADF